MRRFRWHDWRLGLGASLMLLAWGGVAPQVRAGCETPTVVLWPAAEASHQTEAGSSNHSMPDGKPCSGPHCSRAPLVPPASPVITTSPSQESACLAVLPGGADCQEIAYRLEDDFHTPIFRTFRIYHPPR